MTPRYSESELRRIRIAEQEYYEEEKRMKKEKTSKTNKRNKKQKRTDKE